MVGVLRYGAVRETLRHGSACALELGFGCKSDENPVVRENGGELERVSSRESAFARSFYVGRGQFWREFWSLKGHWL